jgi:molybdopterin-containing oxidoreductase family iron-sulfur binding subunit
MKPDNKKNMPDEIKEKLKDSSGEKYWRCLEELAETDEFRSYLEQEFPRQSRPLGLNIDRRQFLTLMGGALAMAGLTGCRFMPQQKIVPYVRAPEDLTPGNPLFYATGMEMNGYAVGLLATSNMGRPIKLDGNDLHPSSMGGSDPFIQSSILDMYDPDRMQMVMHQGEVSSWKTFVEMSTQVMKDFKAKKGEGLRFLTEAVSSPALAFQLEQFLKDYPLAKWHQYDPINRDNERAGALIAFGRDVHPVYHLDKAERILSLGADFLTAMPGHSRYALDFAEMRRVRAKQEHMNRLYCVESTPTPAGAIADHRLLLKPSDMDHFARALAAQLGIGIPGVQPMEPYSQKWMAALAQDLKQNSGKCVVIVGEEQPPAIHALGHAMNEILGAPDKTVSYIDPVQANPVNHMVSLKELVNDMAAGKVQGIVIFGGNPAYNSPADIDFAGQLGKLSQNNGFTVALTYYSTETAYLCQWNLPQAHFLEAWSDGKGHDGTACIFQPLIEPLFGGHSSHELITALTGEERQGYDIIHDYWIHTFHSADAEMRFGKMLVDGVLAGSESRPVSVKMKAGWEAEIGTERNTANGSLEILFRPDPCILDGRYANNSWLQEIPKPLSKIVWDNAVYISPATGKSLGLADDDVINLTWLGRTISGPVYIMPGHADNCATVFLGYGRTRGGKVCEGIGYNAYTLYMSTSPWQGDGLQVAKTGQTHALVNVRAHHSMEGRDICRTGSLLDYIQNPHLLNNQAEADSQPKDSLYPPYKYEGYGDYAWAMSIDTNVCIGCNACVSACQAENNIPVVGKDQVSRGREMSWIRIDTYYKGNAANPETCFEPIPCMQCEDAPCEPVCPVGATSHSHEGLNQQVYNRCVGTRYCSNNCPYKVRRFNFYKYTAGQPDNAPGYFDNPIMQLLANPDVTVRGRGVMEKCTYCVQRINRARINAKVHDREVHDGEIVTACQSACPTRAIIFGNLNDPNSKVSLLKKEPADFSVLGSLNTRPRTTYLPRLKNPNPEIEAIVS